MMTRRIIALTFLCGSAMFVHAGVFKTEIISSTDSPLVINLPATNFLRIITFTQEGGSTRGVVMVQINGESANVLSASQLNAASLATPPDVVNRAIIAGPATVTVAPVPGATLFLTYRRLRNGEAQASPTPTPAPTVTPSPTPTATP